MSDDFLAVRQAFQDFIDALWERYREREKVIVARFVASMHPPGDVEGPDKPL